VQKNLHNESELMSTVAVVGLGKIGLPLAVQYAQHSWHVIGCDINISVVEEINAGRSHVQEEPELITDVPRLVHEGLLSATLDTTSAIREAHVVVVIVPVFIDAQHNVDFRSIDAATRAVGAGLKPGTLVIYETTLPVGTTSGRLRQLLEATSGLKSDHDFYLAYSPERVSSGSIFRDLRTYPKVVGGINEESTAVAVQFYQSVLDAEVITMASTDDAEFVKLIETTYRDVNIALANEYARYADARGLNVTSAIAAANTQPYSHIHTPGVGVGGHCIPVYPYFLFANPEDRELHAQGAQHLALPRRARIINDEMAEYAVERIESVIGSLSGLSVLILGVAYRGNVRETAFTSAKLLQEALIQHGATVYVDDPLFTEDELRSLGYRPQLTNLEMEIAAIILQSGHYQYRSLDFSRFAHCQIVLDGRQILNRDKIEALGMRYVVIGDGHQAEETKSKMLTRHVDVGV
jgi:nucleotide sugar dehydrogenase